MKYIQILLVGDIHYPDASYDLDHKDHGISSTFAQKIATNPLRPVLNKLQQQAKGSDAILFCGDFTTMGCKDGYEKCVNWLERALGLHSNKHWATDQVHVVLGNHDVDRKLCDPTSVDHLAKFGPYLAAWRLHGLEQVVTTSGVRTTRIERGKAIAQVFSMNSCTGCGEFRHLPEKIQAGIRSHLEPLLADPASRTALASELRYLWESLDSPAFVGEDIESLIEGIDALPKNIVPVVLAHHNLLPQKTLRIAPYTELLNSGEMRSQLSSLPVPVVYLHGHIHDDPIEIIRRPESDAAPLICISAPEFRKGFLAIRFAYTSNGIPLGVEVLQYKLSHGSTRCNDVSTARLPFWNALHFEQRCSPTSQSVFALLKGRGMRVLQFNEIKHQAVSLSLSDKRLADALEEMEWIGLARISNRDESLEHWKIEGVTS